MTSPLLTARVSSFTLICPVPLRMMNVSCSSWLCGNDDAPGLIIIQALPHGVSTVLGHGKRRRKSPPYSSVILASEAACTCIASISSCLRNADIAAGSHSGLHSNPPESVADFSLLTRTAQRNLLATSLEVSSATNTSLLCSRNTVGSAVLRQRESGTLVPCQGQTMVPSSTLPNRNGPPR